MPDVQPVNPAPSSEHSKVTPGLLELNVNVADVVATVPLGPVRIVVSRTVVSITIILMAPSEPADKPTLLRRVHYDLIGVPPTPEQDSEFLKD